MRDVEELARIAVDCGLKSIAALARGYLKAFMK